MRRCRHGAVRQAVAHAWRGYVVQGWGSDDVSPLLGAGIENWHARSTLGSCYTTLGPYVYSYYWLNTRFLRVQPSRDPSTGWLCHSTGGAIPLAVQLCTPFSARLERVGNTVHVYKTSTAALLQYLLRNIMRLLLYACCPLPIRHGP